MKIAIINRENASHSFDGLTVTIDKNLTEDRDRLLVESKAVISIQSSDDVEKAIAVVSALKGIAKTIEAHRKVAKEPVLQLGTAIDSEAKSFSSPITLEVKRLETAVGSFQLAERRKAEEAQRKAQEEAKKAIDAASAAQSSGNELDALDAELEAELAVSQVSEITPIQTKVAGAKTRADYDIEVEDIHALYKAHPECVKLEVKLLSVRDLINRGILDIPGVKLTETIKVSARASSSIKTLK